MIVEKIVALLTRFSELYHIPQWLVNVGAIAIVVILVTFPFVVWHLMKPKYYRFREIILFKVLWKWKYKKGDIVDLWCYCPKCQAMLMVDDENCRSTESLQHKITYFICNECGGNEISRVVGGDRRYALSLVKRDIWRHVKDGTFNEVSAATKEALQIYQGIILTTPTHVNEASKRDRIIPEASQEQDFPQEEAIVEKICEQKEDVKEAENSEVDIIEVKSEETPKEEPQITEEEEKETKKDGI